MGLRVSVVGGIRLVHMDRRHDIELGFLLAEERKSEPVVMAMSVIDRRDRGRVEYGADIIVLPVCNGAHQGQQVLLFGETDSLSQVDKSTRVRPVASSAAAAHHGSLPTIQDLGLERRQSGWEVNTRNGRVGQ